MGLTDKQKAVLRKAGHADADIDKMSDKYASDLIGHIFAKKDISSSATLDKPRYEKKEYVKDVNPFYTSYAKDLFIAMLNAQVTQGKKDIDIVVLMDTAIMMVGSAKERLK